MKLSLFIAGQTAALIILSVVIYFGYQWVDSRHREFFYAQHLADQLPAQRAVNVVIANDLAKYQSDIATAARVVIGRDDLVKVVSALEAAAEDNRVAITIPLVTEHKKVNAEGQPVEGSGPTLDARLQIIATGDPVRLLQFAYAAEHLPYLVALVSLQLETIAPDNQNSLAANAPDGAAIPPAVTGRLEMDVIVTVLQSGAPSL